MTSEETHTQCDLQHASGRRMLSWIPTRFARVGARLRLGQEPGWEVLSAYNRLPTTYLLEHERDYKIQREASDIDEAPSGPVADALRREE